VPLVFKGETQLSWKIVENVAPDALPVASPESSVDAAIGEVGDYDCPYSYRPPGFLDRPVHDGRNAPRCVEGSIFPCCHCPGPKPTASPAIFPLVVDAGRAEATVELWIERS